MIAVWMAALAVASSGGPGPDAPFQLNSAPSPLQKTARTAPVSYTPLQPLIDEAAAEFQVPAVLLSALVWEASHYDPDLTRQWAGYGPMDLRDGRDPDVERAAILLGISADDLSLYPRENIRGGAALLAEQAKRSNGGRLPDVDLLEDWWEATKLFSGSHDPTFQRNFASYLFEQVLYGVNARVSTGERVQFGRVPVDLQGLLAADGLVLQALPDYPGSSDFEGACSSNYTNDSRSGGDIEYVVVHTTQGSYSGAISWFGNCSAQVSAHYVVRSSDGEITQTVAEEDIAWHAGNWTYNELSIGIEHEGYIEDPEEWYTDEMYQASANLVIDILSRTDVQADRDHIVGHIEIPGSTHTDPGSGWDWDYYMSLIEGSYVIAGDLQGIVAVEDVYTGDPIEGAVVTLLETGDDVEVDEDGLFIFEHLPEGEYTVVAVAEGYEDAGCTTTIDGSGTFWCSIAMFEGESSASGDDDDDDEGKKGKKGKKGRRAIRNAIKGAEFSCSQTPVGRAGAWLPLLLAFAATVRYGSRVKSIQSQP